MADFYKALCEILDESQIRSNEPMKNHTTFRVGGPADYFVRPADSRQLAAVLKLCREQEMPHYLIGNGSNLLVGDKGYRGVVISLDAGWSYCRADGAHLTAGAGLLLSKAAKTAAANSLTGMEFAAGIPGTIGGAAVMNAGAYGGEMKDILVRVQVISPEGDILNLAAPQLELGYRTSCIPGKGYIVLEAEMLLKHGEKEVIQARMDELAAARREKQPLEYPSAGSTFKRPEGYFAGKLIQDSGLKGFRVGGAQVSEKHSGFVINRGHATAADIIELCGRVKQKVCEDAGVELEMEVRQIGEF